MVISICNSVALPADLLKVKQMNIYCFRIENITKTQTLLIQFDFVVKRNNREKERGRER